MSAAHGAENGSVNSLGRLQTLGILNGAEQDETAYVLCHQTRWLCVSENQV